jgi:hypothetical protein
MDAHQETLDLLAKYKCKLTRTKRHNIYTLPSGLHYATPKTASDAFSWDNQLSQLKVALGISRRGRKAKVGARPEKKAPKKTSPSKADILEHVAPAPQRFNLREKIRAALRGEKLSNTPEPPPLPIEEPPQKERFRMPRTEHERHRHGVVRVWSRQDIEAANTALRVGKLDEFLARHDSASRPEAVTIDQPNKEELTMLAVEQIDATIQELDAGMAAAMEMVKTEESNIERLSCEVEQARQRMAAAHDKNNSLNDVKTSLSCLRGDIEKVRPMLGLLAHQPAEPTVLRTRTAGGSSMRVADAIRFVLDRAEVPLRAGQIHEEITKIHRCEKIAKTSIYTFLSVDKKNNGSAIATHMTEINAYWRSTRPLPSQGGVA